MTDAERDELLDTLADLVAEDQRDRRELALALAHMGREGRLLKQALFEDGLLLRVTDGQRKAVELRKAVQQIRMGVFNALVALQPERKRKRYSQTKGEA